MVNYYLDYCWKEGIPYGIRKLETPDQTSYRILADPYRKRISIEKYHEGNFFKVVYDSHLFDFRSLKTLNQAAWRKENLEETSEKHLRRLIRDHDDRAVLIEEYTFTEGKCTECRTQSIHGIPVSHQHIYYASLGNSFNGVVLYDANDKIVMEKRYTIDESSGEFGELQNENWNPQSAYLSN